MCEKHGYERGCGLGHARTQHVADIKVFFSVKWGVEEGSLFRSLFLLDLPLASPAELEFGGEKYSKNG